MHICAHFNLFACNYQQLAIVLGLFSLDITVRAVIGDHSYTCTGKCYQDTLNIKPRRLVESI